MILAFDFYGTFKKYKDPFENEKEYENFVDTICKKYQIPKLCCNTYHHVFYDIERKFVTQYFALFKEDCLVGINIFKAKANKANTSIVPLDQYFVKGYIGEIQ